MKAHLMFPARDFEKARVAERPLSDDLVRDLELGTLLMAMAGGDAFVFDSSRLALLSGVVTPEDVRYRQAVLRDFLDHPDVVRELYAIAVEALDGQRHIYGFFRQHPSGILSSAVRSLELFVDQLKRLRHLAEAAGDSCRSEGVTTLMRMLQDQLDDEYFRTVEQHLKQLRFRNGVLMSARLDPANRGTSYELLTPPPPSRGLKARLGIGGPPSYSFEIHPRDEAGARALSDLRDRGINLVANALAQSTDHISSFFEMLRSEVAFYLGCVNLRDRLTELGRTVCFPDALDPERGLDLTATGLYDVCLPLVTGKPVVTNDVVGTGCNAFFITGANSGGKSTFLRSVGLAHLMMQAGLFVGATSFRANLCTGYFTHFIREEDASMTSGKLDEELSRMSAIADRVEPGAMVLFNESFSATNESEGSEIARQTVAALLDSGIKVLFVTHLFDLAESMLERHDHGTMFLRAERLEDGTRSYKVVEGPPLSTSFGEDLYAKVFGRPSGQPAAAPSGGPD